MNVSPPAFLRRLLELALPVDVRDGIVGDLDEVYHTRRSGGGALTAGLWYLTQVLAISARFLGDRLGEVLPSVTRSLGLDMKLGFRMLIKYPMLTLVGGIAITVATAVGVGTSEFIRDLLAPTLPLQDGDRIVRLYQADSEAGQSVQPTLYDLGVWREGVSALQDLGAFTTSEQGLVGDRGEVGTVNLARMSASGFRITAVPARLGRFYTEADERPGAEPVVVLGHGVWQTILGGDPGAVGRTIQVGGSPATVIGVMPEGYSFPMTQNAWVPLPYDAANLEPGTASRAAVFGRLAPGATLASARAELEVVGARLSADFPDVYRNLRPGADAYAGVSGDMPLGLILSAVRLLFIFLLVVACANVATLVFARTVMREGEIAVRTSMGATRRRIVLQLTAEALVLVGGATALGLVIAWWALGHVGSIFFMVQQEPQPPFWWDNALSPVTVAYALGLAFVGALMVGVVPALKATSGALQPRLGQLSGGGGGGLRFGGMWTVIIVLQVALSVAFLPLAVSQAGAAFEDPVATAFPAAGYVTAQLGRDPAIPPRTAGEEAEFMATSQRLFQEVKDRVAADPTVQGAALASGLSAMNHVQTPLEFTGDGAGPALIAYARVLLVDPEYLDLMGATVVGGRTLGSADFTPESRSVLVNAAFVDQVLEGGNAVGGQLRFPDRQGEAAVVTTPASGTSVEIVGVVQDPGVDLFGPGAHPTIYAPLDLAPVSPRQVGLVGMPQPPATQLFVRMQPGAEPLGAALHGIVGGVDPALRLSEVGTLADAWLPVHQGARLGAWVFMGLAGIVLMLSVAGIYALMSFTVSRRTREIAIRTAVGAGRGQIVRTVFGRAFLQLVGGVALGSLVAVPVLWDGVVDDGPRSLLIVASLLLAAGVVACLVPVRRALAIQPAAAMKAD